MKIAVTVPWDPDPIILIVEDGLLRWQHQSPLLATERRTLMPYLGTAAAAAGSPGITIEVVEP